MENKDRVSIYQGNVVRKPYDYHTKHESCFTSASSRNGVTKTRLRGRDESEWGGVVGGLMGVARRCALISCSADQP